MAVVKDVPGLPRVLIIGDSISIAYTIPVREALKGKANVHRVPVNASSSAGPGRIKVWLGNEHWDVVVFNFGIHDAKIKGGKPSVSLDAYEKNLRDEVAILKASGAKVLFANTTPIPPVVKPEGRNYAPIPPYNALMLPVEQKYQRPYDVHFTAEGSEYIAQTLAKAIEALLPPAAKP
jgi:acyl-CoA thioesterase-1